MIDKYYINQWIELSRITRIEQSFEMLLISVIIQTSIEITNSIVLQYNKVV